MASTQQQKIIKRIDTIEKRLRKSIELVDRIACDEGQTSICLFRETQYELLRVIKIILYSVLETTADAQTSYLNEAIEICEQIYRELLRTHISYCIAECESLQNTYRRVLTEKFNEAYQNNLEAINDAKSKIKKQRVPIKTFEKAFKSMSNALAVLDAYRPELYQSRLELETKEYAEHAERRSAKTRHRWVIVGTVIGLIASIVVIWGFIEGKFTSTPNSEHPSHIDKQERTEESQGAFSTSN